LLPLLRVLLAGFGCLAIVGFSWMLIAAAFDIEPLDPTPRPFGRPTHVKFGPALIAWGLLVPLSLHALRRVWKAKPVEIESAAVLVTTCVTVLLAGFALPASAGTLKFFLAVLAAVVGFGVSLVLATTGWRYGVLSIFAVLHFAGIATATLASPPSPWLVTQIFWHRFAHSYLEFMYLNNAYHFYAPDPGPATYLWFRVVYVNPDLKKREDAKETDFSTIWVKIPDVGPDGSHRYRVSLEYQRHLSLTENVAPAEPVPPLYYRDPNGQLLPSEFFKNRLANSPNGKHWQQVIVGKEEPRIDFEVKLHPFLPAEQQYQKPMPSGLRLISSYVRHLANQPHPEKPNWTKVDVVRVYKVIHALPVSASFAEGADPNSPELYRPFYLGMYNPDGNLRDPEEPLIYWMLPVLREPPDSPEYKLMDCARWHAGDPDYFYDPVEKTWSSKK
jgi:hypothetical protein